MGQSTSVQPLNRKYLPPDFLSSNFFYSRNSTDAREEGKNNGVKGSNCDGRLLNYLDIGEWDLKLCVSEGTELFWEGGGSRSKTKDQEK